MKRKPKTVWGALLIVVVVLALIAAVHFLGVGTTRSAMRIGYVEKGGWHDWSASYMRLDGTMRHTLRPEASDSVLRINVETESGTIAIEVKNTKGELVFQQEDLGTKEFDVELTEKVSVIVHAKGHKGSFDFSFASSK